MTNAQRPARVFDEMDEKVFASEQKAEARQEAKKARKEQRRLKKEAKEEALRREERTILEAAKAKARELNYTEEEAKQEFGRLNKLSQGYTRIITRTSGVSFASSILFLGAMTSVIGTTIINRFGSEEQIPFVMIPVCVVCGIFTLICARLRSKASARFEDVQVLKIAIDEVYHVLPPGPEEDD